MLNLNKFRPLREILEESLQRLKDNKPEDICIYPIKCLNDFLFGIIPSELVIIGGDTGTGKSSMAERIAMLNAMNNKKVALASLEGDKDEFINRWRWEIICREYYRNPRGIPMQYPLFIMNKINGIDHLLDLANEEIKKISDNLFVFDRNYEFTVDILTQQMELIKDSTNLLIIDHLHYFNLFDDQSEARQISKIMQTIRKFTDVSRIPTVLISHLRKKDKDRGAGGNEDFMGSSNIPKISTTSIIMNPCYQMNKDDYAATIIRVTKSRYGMRPDIGFCIYYDTKRKLYSDDYDLVRFSLDNKFKVLKESEYPNWVKEFKFKRYDQQEIEAIKTQFSGDVEWEE